MKTSITQELKEKLIKLPFSKQILDMGGMIYSVGGAVRDAFLNKESKDLDIMITGIELSDLISILKVHGKVDLVGESFGIIKFKVFGEKEDIDISIPRREMSNGDRGHKAFTVVADPFLPIEDDLIRRDFTMNSIAMDIQGNIIDPFDGILDLTRGIVRHTNSETFFDDPLRMLRAVQFASRFKFIIDPLTMSFIAANAARIQEIPGERILIELTKIQTKGDMFLGVNYLMDSGLFSHIFGEVGAFRFIEEGVERYKLVKTMGEFIYVTHGFVTYPSGDRKTASTFWLHDLKGDLNTHKEIKALEEMSKYQWMSGHHLMLPYMFTAFKIFPGVIDTQIFNDKHFQFCIQQFKSGLCPKSFKELAIKGDELTAMGYSGPEIGTVLNKLVSAIFNGKIQNDKVEILQYLKQ